MAFSAAALGLAVIALAALWIARHQEAVSKQGVVAKSEAARLAQDMVRSESTQNRPAHDVATPAAVPALAAITEAQRAVEAQMVAAQTAYTQARQDLDPARLLDLAQLATADAITDGQKRVRTFAAANGALRESVDLAAFHFSSELRDRGVAEAAVREAISTYRSGTEKELPWIKRIRDADDRYAAALWSMLDFAARAHGQWRVTPDSDRKPEFTSPAVARLHDDIIHQARLAEMQAEFASKQLREVTGK